jgi:hypothetical protein
MRGYEIQGLLYTVWYFRLGSLQVIFLCLPLVSRDSEGCPKQFAPSRELQSTLERWLRLLASQLSIVLHCSRKWLHDVTPTPLLTVHRRGDRAVVYSSRNRVARGEVKMHMESTSPYWWGEELLANINLN